MSRPNPDPLDSLARLVVKDQVTLGGLARGPLLQALAFVWAGLRDAPATEREINEALKAQLRGAASFLDADHVELRRWLVDTGFLRRDGFGHEYRRTAAADLADEARSPAAALLGIDTASFTRSERARHRAGREARHAEWLARHKAGTH